MSTITKAPKFTIYAGPMFSGKTTSLLLDLERAFYRNEPFLLFKPAKDDRYGLSKVSSHMAVSRPAINIETGADIIETVFREKAFQSGTIAVDEAFMIPEIASVLTTLYILGFNIIVSTIDFSSDVKPFEEVVKMLPWATRVKKCFAVCSICGGDAHFTFRKKANDNGSVIQIGGASLYEPRCSLHHPNFFIKPVKSELDSELYLMDLENNEKSN